MTYRIMCTAGPVVVFTRVHLFGGVLKQQFDYGTPSSLLLAFLPRIALSPDPRVCTLRDIYIPN